MNATASSEGRARLVLITGLSGSGKSIVAKCFEDLGYYTVDNLPLALLASFLDDPLRLVPGHDRLAVVTDVRAPGFAEEFPRLVAAIDRSRIRPTLLFLEATEDCLIRRFSETRRPHPLAGGRPLLEGIHRERAMLEELRGMADLVFDTSDWSIHEARSHVFREFAERPDEAPGMVVSLVSFGFKYGIPHGSDLVFDVRFLPNPHFVPELKEASGQDRPVLDFLDRQPEFPELLSRLRELLLFLLPRFRLEHRSYLSVAVGCTGGRHRSVAVCERLSADLEGLGWPVRLVHRDVDRHRS